MSVSVDPYTAAVCLLINPATSTFLNVNKTKTNPSCVKNVGLVLQIN